MNIFGQELSKIESHLFGNIKYTKSVFPEETKLIEFGLALLWRFTNITNEAAIMQKRINQILLLIRIYLVETDSYC